MAQEIAHEKAKNGNDTIVINGHSTTIIEAILRKWATSKDARLQMAFVEYAYGKPPTKNEVHNLNVDFTKLTNEQLLRIAQG